MPISLLQYKALELSRDLGSTPANQSRVARATDAEASRWAFAQWGLRKRARAKFALADQMLFTKSGLEMATHERVASWRADRFPTDVQVVDLTCGLGGDLIALASRGPVVGFETDPLTLAYARHNLDAHGLQATLHLGDGTSAQQYAYAFADPARRDGLVRKSDPDEFSPHPAVVASHFSTIRLGAVKLSPMLDDEFLTGLGAGLEFVSHQHECCEALVWCGSDARAGRYAIHVESNTALGASQSQPFAASPKRYVAEADPAAIRAHALGSWVGYNTLATSLGYLTTDVCMSSPWLTHYEVVWHGAYREKRVAESIAAHSLRLVAVKKRHVDIDPAVLLKKLKKAGEREAVLLCYPDSRRVMCVLAVPILA